ncbi:MAG TPA: hypothetical protein VH595_06310 [Verrucomicrobiae bacterium]|nr:hypothetical protein [Verrucomicrobiae bacterium]
MTSVVAYGLAIQSEIQLPEAPATTAPPQVIIRFGKVEKPRGAADAERVYAIDREEFRVFWRGVGTFVIRSGREVIIEPEPDCEEAIMRLYVLGPALGILLHQRGLLVLHASVVSIDGCVIGFLGEKGWGKSTMAAALNARGHALVTDDILAVTPYAYGPPMAQPGLPHFKLWPEAVVASFGGDPNNLVRIHSKVEKRIREADSDVGWEPAPLRRLYVLDRGPTLESIPMTQSMALMALVRHSYLSRFMRLLDGTKENFLQCSRLVQSASIHRLQRPSDLNVLGEVVRLVEAEAWSDSPAYSMNVAISR